MSEMSEMLEFDLRQRSRLPCIIFPQFIPVRRICSDGRKMIINQSDTRVGNLIPTNLSRKVNSVEENGRTGDLQTGTISSIRVAATEAC